MASRVSSCSCCSRDGFPRGCATAGRRRSIVNNGPRYGPHIGYNFDAKAVLLGAQLSWPIVPSVDLYPTFDYYFVSGGRPGH